MIYKALLFAILSGGLSLAPLAVAETAEEGLDYGMNVPARTHSPALALIPYVGYGKLLWGESSSPMYGFIRPSLAPVFSTSLVGARASLEIFPISFAGFSMGRTYLYRFSDPTGQDCENVECQGSLAYSDLGAQLALAYQGFFISSKYLRSFFEVDKDQTQPVLEPALALLLVPGENQLSQLNVAVGRQVNEKLSVGLLFQQAELSRDGGEQQAQYLFAQSKLDDYGYSNAKLTVGIGSFESQVQESGLSLLMNLAIIGKEPLGLGR